MTLRERFEKKYVRDQSGCWLWGATRYPNGYGQLMVRKDDGKWGSALAHRLSWQFHNGDIPDGLNVLHRCDVRNCVNPSHLFLGSQADNMSDCSKKGRHFSFFKGATHCKRGHEFSPENTHIKVHPVKGKYRSCRECSRQWERAHG